jgi:ribosomal protein S24E
MEYTAEDLIAHKLQRAGILISKPKFDREGTDLIALMEVKGGASFCRIQCKGRSLIKSESSSIKIPQKYVTDSFVTFLYIDDGNEENTHLFTFFVDDIIKWNLNDKNEYVLSFRKSNFEKRFTDNTFSEKSVEKIKKIIAKANVNREIRIVMPPIAEGFAIGKIQGNGIIYQDASKEARVEQSTAGLYQTIIKNRQTGIETVGSSCPGDPKDFGYNPHTDVWVAKMKKL